MLAIRSDCQSVFTITLRVEEQTSYTVYHNEPLVFSTSLLNQKYQKDLEWNEAADTWLARLAADYQAGRLSKEEFEKETARVTNGKRTLQQYTIGTSQSPWFRQLQFRILMHGIKKAAWPVEVLGAPPKDAIAILDEKGYYLVRHHLSPEQVLKTKPGTYQIQVLLGGASSNIITVHVTKQNIPGGVLKSETMQLRLGNYYLARLDTDKALNHAYAVLKKNPNSLNGLILSGEIYIQKKNYRKALTFFEKALKQHQKTYPDSIEPPEHLQTIIAWLKLK